MGKGERRRGVRTRAGGDATTQATTRSHLAEVGELFERNFFVREARLDLSEEHGDVRLFEAHPVLKLLDGNARADAFVPAGTGGKEDGELPSPLPAHRPAVELDDPRVDAVPRIPAVEERAVEGVVNIGEQLEVRRRAIESRSGGGGTPAVAAAARLARQRARAPTRQRGVDCKVLKDFIPSRGLNNLVHEPREVEGAAVARGGIEGELQLLEVEA